MDAIFHFFLDITMSSTYIDKNNSSLRRPNKHWQFDFFLHSSLNKTSWNYRSQNTYWFCSRGATGSSILDHDFCHLCLGRRIHTSDHSDFEIFSNLGNIFQCYLEFCRYCIRSLSFMICKICNYMHDFRRSHLRRRRSLLYVCRISVARPLDFWIFDSNSVFFKWYLFIIEVKWTFFLCLYVSRMFSFLLSISHELTDTFISISFFFFLSTIHLYLDSKSLDLFEWEYTLVLETLSRSRCQKHFLL